MDSQDPEIGINNDNWVVWKKAAKVDRRRDFDFPGKKKDKKKVIGIYVFRLKKTFPRLKGRTDILYIGSTKAKGGLHERLWSYVPKPGRTQETNKRISPLLKLEPYIGRVEIGCRVCCEPRALERRLLCRFEQEHDELPPWNHTR